jgi:hypothetical protein
VSINPENPHRIESFLVRISEVFAALVILSMFLILLAPFCLLIPIVWNRLYPLVPADVATYVGTVYHDSKAATPGPYTITRNLLEVINFTATAIVAGIALVAFIVTWSQLREVRKSRLAPVYMEISQKWDSDGLAAARFGINVRISDGTLNKPLPPNLQLAADRDFLMVISYLEDIGLLCRRGYLDIGDMADILGSSMIHYIDALRPQIDRERRDAGDRIRREAKYANILWLRSNLEKIRSKHPYRWRK